MLTIDAGDTQYPAMNLAAGDANGDGLSDLLVLNVSNVSDAPTLGWSLGLADGGFAAFQFMSLSGVLPNFSSNNRIMVADFNNDGYADIILTDTNSQASQISAYLFLGSPSGFSGSVHVWNGAGVTDTGIGVGDINNDGWADFVVGGPEFYVILNQTDGGFEQATNLPSPIPGSASATFAIADLNEDGLPDLIVPGDPVDLSWKTQVSYQSSDGGFSEWISLTNDPGSHFVAGYGSRLLVANSSEIGLVHPTDDGGICGTFSPVVAPSPDFFGSVAVDLDHDGRLDVVSLGASSLVSFLRTTTGWVPVGLSATGGHGLVSLADGRVVVSDPADQQIVIFNSGCSP